MEGPRRGERLLSRRQLLALSDGALLEQCEMDRFRASGSGGQKRNKTDSAVRLRHSATSTSAQATESRSQHVNRMHALRRLREAFALHHRESVPDDYKLSPELAAALRRGPRSAASKARYEAEYLSAIGELLDVFAACEAGVAETASRLGVSSAELTRLLCGDPHVYRCASAMRKRCGLRPLRA
jgi:hypothetical protein